MNFTPQFTKKMKKSVLREELGYKLQVSYFTICRWLDKPAEDEFTKPKYRSLLSKVSGFPESEIFPNND
jgi:hypothetical protein